MSAIHQNILNDLEFPKVLEQVSDLCITDLGKEAILGISPEIKREDIEPELLRVREFLASLESDNRIPNHGFDPIDKELRLLEIQDSLIEVNGFRRIARLSETTKTLLAFFKKYKEFYIELNAFSHSFTYTHIISDAIEKIIDRFGKIKDNASPNLQGIRKHLGHVRGQINASFSRALTKYAQADYLDEIRESVVDNRRVLAVRAMHRRKVKGAVMGQSKTGSIVYIEPQETLEYANELTNLLYEEEEEIKRILRELTDILRPYRPLLIDYQRYLIAMDMFYAKAKYAYSMDACLPRLTKERRLFMKYGYHPLLYLANKKKKAKTFPQIIELTHNNRIIVISGPNAGGKSITLKTVGLLQVMLQSGFLIPVDPESEYCLFSRVLTDIGDNQSIENHLSTYSYRLKQMNYFLRKCNKNTLFLIDEFGTGSDPELGGALAETFLEVFYEREAFGIITTHYSNLKLLANELPHATNANMQFNQRNLEPMYQLQLGEAGSSFTFEVAQKNGIPFSLINRAKKKLERGKVRFDKTLANLQKERSKLRKTSENLKTEEEKAKVEARQLEETNTRVQQKLESYQELYDSNQKWISLGKKIDSLAESFYHNKKKRQLMDELMKLVLQENVKRKKVAPKEKRVQKQIEKKVIKEVEQKVEVIRKRKKKEKEAAKKVAPKPKITLKVGDRVRMIDGRAVGTIDAIEKKKAIVNYGQFTADVSLNELEKV